MRKRIVLSFLLFMLTFVSFSANDARNQPTLYYLTIDEVLDSMKLLPPPPATDSIAFMNDKAQYEKGKLLRNTPRGVQAYHDAEASPDGVAKAFTEAFGMEISEKKTPEIYKLLQNFKEDAGDLATRGAKVGYMRIRPFAYFKESTCRPEDEKQLSTNGSYPSGHTAIGWATALILAEINPARQTEIITRGYEMGESRVICGYHWQSDLDAARIVSSVVVSRLHSNPKFIAQLNKAKEEFKRLSTTKK